MDAGKRPIVAILMSTYNGEKFLRPQLDSILAQEDCDIKLYIRDDGSSDSTVSILEEYAQKDPDIKVFRGHNLGVGPSFMSLVYNEDIKAEYYAFADQDDVWLPEKLSKAIAKMEGEEGPAMYGSNQTLVNANGEVIRLRYSEPICTDYRVPMCTNKIAGCTIVFNDALMQILREDGRKPEAAFFKATIHDVWLVLSASIVGKVIYDDASYILYRQHENNEIGAKTGPLVYFHQQFKKIKNPTKRNPKSTRAAEVIKRYPDYVGDRKETLEMYAGYRESAKLKWKMLTDPDAVKYDEESRGAYMLRVLLNLK